MCFLKVPRNREGVLRVLSEVLVQIGYGCPSTFSHRKLFRPPENNSLREKDGGITISVLNCYPQKKTLSQQKATCVPCHGKEIGLEINSLSTTWNLGTFLRAFTLKKRTRLTKLTSFSNQLVLFLTQQAPFDLILPLVLQWTRIFCSGCTL